MRLPSLSREPWRGYALATAVALFAVGLQWAVHPLAGWRVPFMFFLPAVMFTSSRYGRGPGLAVALVAFVHTLLVLPPPGLHVEDPEDQAAVLLFLGVAVVVTFGGGRVREIAERAREAERRLVLAVAETGIGVFDLDLQRRTAYVSPSMAQLAGLPVSDRPVPLSTWLACIPKEIAADSREQVLRRLRERVTGYEREIAVPRAGAAPLCLLLRVHVIWERDRAVRLRGTVIDISARKAVDAQLSRTRADLDQQLADLRRLHALSSRLLDDAPLRVHLWTVLDALIEMHGARAGLVSLRDAGDGPLRLLASEGLDPASVRPWFEDGPGRIAAELACHAGQRVVVEDLAADDRVAPMRELAAVAGLRAMHGVPLVGQDGAVLGAIVLLFDAPRAPVPRECALVDICARKAAVYVERERAWAALEAAKDRFRAVLDASAVPFVTLVPVREGPRGRIADFRWTYVNAATARLFGRDPEAMTGRLVSELLGVRGRALAAFRHCVAVAERHVVREFEASVPIAGRAGWFHGVASPLPDSVAVWAADITERKRAEEVLQEADRRKDEFLATLAHELRNPLAPIRQAALTARSAGASEAQRRWSHEVIERQVRHMALLLDDLLDVSRITRGVLALHKGPTDLSSVVEGAVETAQPLIAARQQQLTVDLPAPDEAFEGDALRVSQVLANLLTNASKYTQPEGRIHLRAQREGAEVVIEVADDGIGIAPESLPHVFDMFTQLAPGGAAGEGGLGIGLALARGLVALHGGTLDVHSDGPGLGSVFTVRLPVGAATAAGATVADRGPAAPEADRPPRAADPGPPGGGARRILVADDNRDAADSLAMLLRMAGHEVVLAYDGAHAVEVWGRERPDVCLLDIGMPGRDGNEVARAIRRLPGGERPLLVAITGWGQGSDRAQALSAGFDEHVTKPVDPDLLLALVDHARTHAQRATA